MNMVLLVNNSHKDPLGCIVPDKSLCLLLAGYLNAEVRAIVAHAMIIAQELYNSRWPFYLLFCNVNNLIHKFNGEAAAWVLCNAHQLLAMANRYKGVQALADQFSEAMGIQRVHAFQFYSCMNKTSGQGLAAPFGKAPLAVQEHSLQPAMMAIINMIAHDELPGHQDSCHVIENMLVAKWLTILGVIAYEQYNVAIGIEHYLTKLRQVVLAICKKDPNPCTCNNCIAMLNWMTKRRFTQLAQQERAAAGARVMSGSLCQDLKHHNCLP